MAIATPVVLDAVESPALRSWRWTLAVAATPPIVGIAAALLAPEPHGHWVEHFSSTWLKSAQLAVLVVIAILLRRAWSPFLLLTLGIVAVGIGFQVVGDAGVARSIWRTTGDPGFGLGYAEGHDTSGLGDLIVVIGGLGFAVVGGLTRRLSLGGAVTSALLAFIPPPFFWPAVGVLAAMLRAMRTGGDFRPATSQDVGSLSVRNVDDSIEP